MKLKHICEQVGSGFVYRGMSNEEWENAIKTGHILSDCRFAPYEHQDNGSCFGSYDRALYAATALPIEQPEHIDWEWRSETPRSKPYTGIVIEIPRDLVMDHGQDERVEEDEYWAFGPISIEQITKAWEFTPNFDSGSAQFSEKRIK